MRLLVTLIGFLLFLPSFAGADEAAPPSKLPADAAKLITKADADIAAIRHTLVTQLQKSQEAATKKGDLDGALAVKSAIEEMSKLLPVKPKAVAPVVAVQKATWGGEIGGPTTRDVTAAFNSALANGPVTLQNTLFGFDPAPNAGKILTVTFTKSTGRTVTKTFPENSIVTPEQLEP
jgi:hypothetical protein